MNVNDYISSGILEAYALGELSYQERVEVEKVIAQYPEIKKELALIEQTQEAVLMRMAIQPDKKVKEELLSRIASKPAGKVVPLSNTIDAVRIWKWAVAASVSIALVASYLAYSYYSNWKSAQHDLTDLLAQNERMAQDYNRVNQRLDKIESDFLIAYNPAFVRVVMKGTAQSPDAMASVFWNETSKEVYLSVQNMKQLAQENQYQLWAIIDGKPVDAGVFDPTFTGLLKMKSIGSGATTFAVTIEPRGGKASPTLETMQVAGSVVKG